MFFVVGTGFFLAVVLLWSANLRSHQQRIGSLQAGSRGIVAGSARQRRATPNNNNRDRGGVMESNNKSKVFTYENGLLLLLGFTFGIVFFERNAIGPLASYIINDLALSQAQIGMLGSGLSLAWAIAAYVIGAWSDRTRSAQTVPARVGRSCSRCARRCPVSPPPS